MNKPLNANFLNMQLSIGSVSQAIIVALGISPQWANAVRRVDITEQDEGASVWWTIRQLLGLIVNEHNLFMIKQTQTSRQFSRWIVMRCFLLHAFAEGWPQFINFLYFWMLVETKLESWL